MSAAILCLVFCIYDVMKKAVMCSESIKVQGFIELFAPGFCINKYMNTNNKLRQHFIH